MGPDRERSLTVRSRLGWGGDPHRRDAGRRASGRAGVRAIPVGLALCVLATLAAPLPGGRPVGAAFGQVPPALLQVPTERLREPGPIDPDPRTPLPGSRPADPTVAPDGARDVQITLSAIVVEGATRLSPERIEAATEPLIGRPIPVAALFELATRLERLYRAEGYILAQVIVPPQRIEGGRARLVVSEGQIDAVRLVGEVGPAVEQARRYLEVVTETRPLDLATLERALLLVEDIPGFTAQGLLRPGLTPGSAELVVELARQPIQGVLVGDNRASAYQGQEQVNVSLGFNAFTSLGERTELLLLSSLTGEQNFGQVSGDVLVGREGTRIRAYGGFGNTLPSGFLAEQDTDTRLAIAGIGAYHPVIKSRREELVLGAAFEVYRSRTDTNLDLPETRSDLRILRLSAEGFLRDGWLGINTGWLRLSQGLDAFGATAADDPASARLGARPDFTKAAFEVMRLQALFATESVAFNLQGRLAGQWTDDILPSSEKFFLGGDRLTRGFYAGQVTGDRGVAGGLELQANFRLIPDNVSPSEAVPVQLYVFYDAGWAWNIPEDETTSAQRLRSAGGGIRFDIGEQVRIEVELANRLTRRPDGADADPVEAWESFWRVIFVY